MSLLLGQPTYEGARQNVARFPNAPSTNEVILHSRATEAINLVAKSWGKRHIGKDDEIVISWIEHHANIVPWQMLAARRRVPACVSLRSMTMGRSCWTTLRSC